MANVKINIQTTQISEDGQLKPKTALWAFKNTGAVKILINNNYALLPGDIFGFSGDALVAQFLERDIPVQSDTVFDVRFINTPTVKGTGHLIETYIDYKK